LVDASYPIFKPNIYLGISLWEMINLAGEENIDWIGYDEDDLRKSLDILNS